MKSKNKKEGKYTHRADSKINNTIIFLKSTTKYVLISDEREYGND